MHRIKRFCRLILTGILLCIAGNTLAQNESQFNHYFRIGSYYNPAYTGRDGKLNVNALYRMQWLGLGDRTPRSIVVAADMPWVYKKMNHGLGVVIVSESAGADEDLRVLGQYSYKKKLGKGVLSIGVQAGMITKSFVADSLNFGTGQDQTPDEIEKSTYDAKSFDIGVGLFYSTAKYYVGLAATQLLQPKLLLSDKMERTIPRSYNLMAGYNIQTRNPLIELRPSIFMQMSSMMAAGDLTVRAVYNNMFNGGLGTRISDSGRFNAAILYLGADIKKFRVNYAYEFPTSALGRATSGSHEFMVTYYLELNKRDGVRNRHKSIRIL